MKLFNTMGRKIEEFKPLKDNEVRMYTCGPTVWNYPHIGNYRTFLFEDLLRRFLKYRGFKVYQVMNLTDVDDRIIKTCNQQKVSMRELTERYERTFFEDLDFLKIERAEVYPRATDHIPEMVKIIQGLFAKKIAYKSDDGSIYYDISAFPDYGKLSGLKLEELKPGARVKQDDYDKSSAEDFALWKAWDENDGAVYWETPLGKGRPGWHIECSAMSMKYLGEEFDIHTGGVDNIFPHHENEIAQSEAYTGRRFARYWMHSEHLLIGETKMSKRLGNIITIKDLKERGVDGIALRYFLLSGHYRAQLNFSDNSLEQAASSVKRINEFVQRLREYSPPAGSNEADKSALDLVQNTLDHFVEAIENDLDTPKAFAIIFDFVTEGNRLLDSKKMSTKGATAILDFMSKDFDSVFGVVEAQQEALPPEIKELLREREEARKKKEWKLSDALRTRLAEVGIEVQDTPEGQKWRRKVRTIS